MQLNVDEAHGKRLCHVDGDRSFLLWWSLLHKVKHTCTWPTLPSPFSSSATCLILDVFELSSMTLCGTARPSSAASPFTIAAPSHSLLHCEPNCIVCPSLTGHCQPVKQALPEPHPAAFTTWPCRQRHIHSPRAIWPQTVQQILSGAIRHAQVLTVSSPSWQRFRRSASPIYLHDMASRAAAQAED